MLIVELPNIRVDMNDLIKKSVEDILLLLE